MDGMTGICKLTILLIAALSLSACSAPNLPLAKMSPLSSSEDSLVRPPWEAYVKANANTAHDVDLETLNGPQAAPPTPIADEPTPPEKPRQVASASEIKIKAVAVLGVTGGSPKSNAELTAAMRKVLTQAGWPVLKAVRNDALVIQGHVVVDSAQVGRQMVHLVWEVLTPTKTKLGDVKQDNSVADGSLNNGWGQNAYFAAQAAGDGIFKLIEKFR